MTTLKERLENFGDYHTVNGEDVYDAPSFKELCAFFHQELLALAEEVEETERDIQNKNVIGFNVAIDKAATLIRAKAAELQ